jgi:potassium efflux system protein
MRQAVDLENTYASALGDMDATLRRYAVVVEHYRDFISQRLLWIPSRGTFSVFRGGGLPVQVAEVFTAGRWLRVLQNLPGEMVRQPLTSVAILMILVLIYFSPLLYRRLVATGRQVGYVLSDHFSSTMHALGLSLLLSLKWPMLLSTVAWLFEMQDRESELAMALYVASVRTAIYFWGLEFLRMTLLPKGLVDAHFRWPARRTATLCRRIARLEQTFLPSVFLFTFCIDLYPREVGGPLGALAVIAILLSIAQFFRLLPSFVQGKMQMMISDGTPREGSFWGRLVRVLLVWVPLGATVAVLFGYTYTAREFALLLIETIVLFSSVLMFHELGLRWLRLTRRRMTYKMRQEHAKASQEEGEISVEDELLESDPDLLSDEGTRLLNVLTLFGGLAGVALIWAGVFPALSILDSVELWHQTGMVDGREVPIPVSLGDVFSAVAIAIIGWVALRRIPSLLEILLRQRANVRPASAYAATRVFQYGATTVLIISVLGMLGGSWGQIQWAVAALSVGIGFGLQEIVANFICGLIILFEQPIRVGDTITVGDVSGKVTRINMRATTVRDFDRRELLVPNKEFITNQLLNWSLSDQVTRRILEVGVAYGSDMDKAMAIVRDVALEHPLVLVDPESIITFEEFGDNSLLISLRFFLDQLEQRIIISSDLRLEINRRFNEAGIVVAFPQRDIHFDASEPLAIKMVE